MAEQAGQAGVYRRDADLAEAMMKQISDARGVRRCSPSSRDRKLQAIPD